MLCFYACKTVDGVVAVGGGCAVGRCPGGTAIGRVIGEGKVSLRRGYGGQVAVVIVCVIVNYVIGDYLHLCPAAVGVVLVLDGPVVGRNSFKPVECIVGHDIGNGCVCRGGHVSGIVILVGNGITAGV